MRKATSLYTGSSASVRKLSSVAVLWISPLSSPSDQNEVTSSTASDPRYPITSQPTGPARSAPAWKRGRPWNRLASLAAQPFTSVQP